MSVADDPHQDVAVKGHVFEVKLVLVSVLVDEGGFEFAFAAGMEALDFNLFGKVYAVAAQKLENSLFCAPVDGELFVAFVVFQVLLFFI